MEKTNIDILAQAVRLALNNGGFGKLPNEITIRFGIRKLHISMCNDDGLVLCIVKDDDVSRVEYWNSKDETFWWE